MLEHIVIKLSLIVFACTASIAAHAYANDLKQVRIPAGELGTALHLLAEQTGVEFFYRSDQVKGRHTAGVTGNLSPQDAVTKLLDGSGLTLKTDSTGAMLIVAPRSAAAHTNSRTDSTPAQDEPVDPGGQKPAFWERFRLAQADRPATAPSVSLDTSVSDSPDSTGAKGKFKDNKAAIPEILVSGSKTLNTDLVRTDDDAQPYTFMSGESIILSGATSVENFLTQNLTMNASSQSFSQQTDSQAGNISSINLRGLGPNQTLILVNGRRLSPFYFFGTTYQPDVNNIPAAAIERIEVLPSSSAAIYGGSAVGGVVNIVLKHNYDGGEVRASYDTPSDGAAPMRTFDAAYGTTLEQGRTHFMVAAHYSTTNALLLRDRLDLAERGIEKIQQNYPGYYTNPGAPPYWGSSTNIAAADGSLLQLKPAYGGQSLGSAITHIPVGTSAATSAGSLGAGLVLNAGSYNLDLGDVGGAGSFGGGLDAQMAGAPVAKSVLTTVRREMTDWLELFVDFSHSENISRINESIFAYSQFVPASAPTNPFVNDVIVGYPDRHSAVLTTELATNRLTGGAIFKLGRGWEAEADYTWNHNRFTYSGQTYDYGSSIDAAFASGEVNPFLDTLANPQSLGQFVGSYGSYFPSSLNDVALRLSGPALQLPAGAVTVTVGLEHRKEAVSDGFGQNTFPSYPADNLFFTYLSQAQKTDSGYVETNIPIISSDNNLPGLRQLDMQAAGRSEHYSVRTGTINTTPGSPPPSSESISYSSTNYTVGLRYRPVNDVMFRMSYGTAFLPPDYSAFQQPLLGGGTPNVTTTVVDPRRGNTTEAVQYIVGGNPAIRPQTSKDWDIGLIYEPEFVRGLRLNVEWYRLTENNVAVTPTFQQIVDAESEFSSRVTRTAAAPGDPYGVGPISVVDASLVNAAKLKTDGFDFSLRYRRDLGGLGTLDFGTAATLIEHFKRQDSLDGPFNELVNQVGAGGPLKLRGNANLAWEMRRWTVGWTINYFGSYRQYDLDGATAYVQAQGAGYIPSQIYHSAFARYQFPSGNQGGGMVGGVLSGVSIQAGVKNIFGKLPPFDAYYVNNGFYSPFGDARLRDFWVSVAKTF